MTYLFKKYTLMSQSKSLALHDGELGTSPPTAKSAWGTGGHPASVPLLVVNRRDEVVFSQTFRRRSPGAALTTASSSGWTAGLSEQLRRRGHDAPPAGAALPGPRGAPWARRPRPARSCTQAGVTRTCLSAEPLRPADRPEDVLCGRTFFI